MVQSCQVRCYLKADLFTKGSIQRMGGFEMASRDSLVTDKSHLAQHACIIIYSKLQDLSDDYLCDKRCR